MKRFDFNATTFAGAENYLKNRAIQLLRKGVVLRNIEDYIFGAIATFTYDGRDYQSIYVYKQFRGKGEYFKLYNILKYTILTTNECDIRDFLKYMKIPYRFLNIYHSESYQIVSKYYGSQKTERTGVYYMNHIDEGLALMKYLNTSKEAEEAYCLHPLFQGNLDLLNTLESDNLYKITNPRVLVYVMEYRSFANAYLSTRTITNIDEIKLSPIAEVNIMLKADKIQNYKDFMKYHKDSHEKAEIINQYFNNWFEALNLVDVNNYINKIDIK